MLAVRWYLRYGLSYRIRELLAERGIEADHAPCSAGCNGSPHYHRQLVRMPGGWDLVRGRDRVKVAGVALRVPSRRSDSQIPTCSCPNAATAHRPSGSSPRRCRPWRAAQIVTDSSQPAAVIADLVPDEHCTERYANRIESDHARLKARLRPMRGLKTDRTGSIASAVTPSFRIYDGAISVRSQRRLDHALEAVSTNSVPHSSARAAQVAHRSRRNPQNATEPSEMASTPEGSQTCVTPRGAVPRASHGVRFGRAPISRNRRDTQYNQRDSNPCRHLDRDLEGGDSEP